VGGLLLQDIDGGFNKNSSFKRFSSPAAIQNCAAGMPFLRHQQKIRAI
jgi:hypothetical protein